MHERYIYSVDKGISLGILLGTLQTSLLLLSNDIEKLLAMHTGIEHIDIVFSKALGKKAFKNSEDNINNSLTSITRIETETDTYNTHVELVNKQIAETMKFYNNVPYLKPINKSNLITYLNERFSKNYQINESQRLANEVLNLKIKQLIQESFESIYTIGEYFLQLNKDIHIPLSKKYSIGFEEAVAILSIGSSETAVFVSGRTIELMINDLLIQEVKQSKIVDFDLKNTKLENKIGKLKGTSLINEKEYHILQKLKFDRNDFGHPFDRDISFNEAKRIILDSIDLAILLEKRLITK